MADTLVREAIAYSSQPLSPVPQYWNSTSYEKVQGANGSIRIMNYNSSGTEIFTGTMPGSVKLTATSTVAISGTTTMAISGTATVAVSGTATVAVSGSITALFQVVGTQANAWSASATISAGATSNSVDVQYCSTINAFGSVTATASITILLQLSQDNSNFYYITSSNSFAASAGTTVNFLIQSNTISSRYVRLITSGVSATITATIAGK